MNTISLRDHGRKRFFPFALSSRDPIKALKLMRPGKTFNFTQRTEDPPSIDQQLADAFNANNAVMAYVLGLENSLLPALSPEPDWYNAFVNQFSDAKTHAMAWQITVTPGLISIPSGIVNYALLWSMNMQSISQAIQVLQQSPGNAQASQVVFNSLQALRQGVTTQLTTATAFQQTIQTFAQQLTTDAASMNVAITNAQGTVGFDQGQVQQLMNDVDALQDQIATWQIVETAAGIAAGVGFFTGAVIGVFTFGAGLAFGIVSALAGIALVIAASCDAREK